MQCIFTTNFFSFFGSRHCVYIPLIVLANKKVQATRNKLEQACFFVFFVSAASNSSKNLIWKERKKEKNASKMSGTATNFGSQQLQQGPPRFSVGTRVRCRHQLPMPGSSDLPSSAEESTSNSSTSSWKYGLVADIWTATMVGWRPYKVLLDPTDDGSSRRSQSYTTIPHDNDSFIEAVHSVDEWNLLVCKANSGN